MIVPAVILFLAAVSTTAGQECGKNQAPFEFNHNKVGIKANLGCQLFECLQERSSKNDSEYYYTCRDDWEASCPYKRVWVGAFRNVGDKAEVRCCYYRVLKYARPVNTVYLNPGEKLPLGIRRKEGKEVDEFHFVANLTMEETSEGRKRYKVWVKAIECAPPPPPNEDDLTDLPEWKTNNPSLRQEDIKNTQGNGNPVPVVFATGCFSGDTEVYHETKGRIPMTEVVVGDKIRSIKAMTLGYLPVIYFIHRDPEKLAEFVEVRTENGIALKMTLLHLMYRVTCDANLGKQKWKMVFAQELLPGDCVVFTGEGRPQKVKVESVRRLWQRGVYSPVTSTGNLIVNDLVASSYSVVKDNALQTCVFSTLARVQEWISSLFGGPGSRVEVPPLITAALAILDKILPAPLFPAVSA